jgi:DNA-binding MarR family transcriptional regulator
MQELPPEDVVDVVLSASRALVAVAARSLAAVQDDMTLPQYRALVLLCSSGPMSMGELAAGLGCSGSAATRLCDRLVSKSLVERAARADNRREVEVRVAKGGRALVAAVTKRRRIEIKGLVEAIPPGQRTTVVEALGALAAAAGEVPDQAWTTGWDL